MQSILAGFLKNNLLNIGDEDSKLQLLEEAAGDLAAKIKETPLLAQRFALVGLSDQLAVNDPVYRTVEAAISAKWATIANKIGADPIQVYRGVALRALQLAGAENAELRYAVILVAQGLPAAAWSGKAREPIAAMLKEFAAMTVDEMSAVWVNPVEISFPKLPTKVKKIAGLKEEITSNLYRSVGPTDKQGKAQNDPNPHWPNNHQAWAHEFAARASDAIHSAVQNGAKGYAEDMTEAIKETLQAWSASLEKLAMRDAKGELLWLRMSQFSPSALASFRSLSPAELILHAAVDTSRLVPGMAPVSVEYFLRELVGALTAEKMKVKALLTAIGPKLQPLPEGKRVLEQEKLPAEGRRGWLDVVARPSAENFENQTGVSANAEETSAELAVHLYRELQIRKLLSSGS